MEPDFERSAMTLKVLMLTSNDYTGRYWRDIAKGFAGTNIKLAFASFGMTQPPIWSDNYTYTHITFNTSSKLNLFNWLQFTLRIRKFNPDVVQSHLFHGGLFGILLGKFLRIPIIYTRHHLDEHFKSGTWIHQWLDRLILRESSRIITCSKATKDWIISMEGALPDHVAAIHQGFDFDQIVADSNRALAIRRDIFMASEKFSILCVSRFSRVKGQIYLLDALVKSEKLREKCKIFFIGIGDSKWLKQEINLRELNDCCSILGASVEVLEYMQACDVVVHPSLADSFSQTIIEAMGIGKCVVAANTAAVPEQIEHGKTGLIFPQGDVDTMIKYLEILISDRFLLKKLGDSAYEAVREKFKLEDMIEQYIYEFQRTCYL